MNELHSIKKSFETLNFGGYLIMTIHKLKIDSKYFDAVRKGFKTFEIRKNDRNFEVGDKLILQEYDREKQVCTGYELLAFVTYITNFVQKMDYVVMAIRVNRPKLNQ